ncbi:MULTISPECIES: hypothetical protein [unclassified Brevibacterium]|uniref:hypothetical protein n=1 Tax=unclassified Brevibacterium TaxID=2614124 RepID=UPI001E5EE1DE|nr:MULTISPECIES: hypothetical protein [unclassified Brevibacterium]MDK8434051.1 hypothetical protein [Brevibacterium sp. H-BE7]
MREIGERAGEVGDEELSDPHPVGSRECPVIDAQFGKVRVIANSSELDLFGRRIGRLNAVEQGGRDVGERIGRLEIGQSGSDQQFQLFAVVPDVPVGVWIVCRLCWGVWMKRCVGG